MDAKESSKDVGVLGPETWPMFFQAPWTTQDEFPPWILLYFFVWEFMQRNVQ